MGVHLSPFCGSSTISKMSLLRLPRLLCGVVVGDEVVGFLFRLRKFSLDFCGGFGGGCGARNVESSKGEGSVDGELVFSFVSML